MPDEKNLVSGDEGYVAPEETPSPAVVPDTPEGVPVVNETEETTVVVEESVPEETEAPAAKGLTSAEATAQWLKENPNHSL